MGQAVLGLIGLVVILGLIGLLIGFILVALYILVVYVLPVALLIGGAYWFIVHPYYPLRRRYQALSERVFRFSLPNLEQIQKEIATTYTRTLFLRQLRPPRPHLASELFDAIDGFFTPENFPLQLDMPPPPEFEWKINPRYGYVRERLDAIERQLDQSPAARRAYVDACVNMLVTYTQLLPPSGLTSLEEFADANAPPSGFLTIPAYDAFSDAGQVISLVIREIASPALREWGLFGRAQNTLLSNISRMSEAQLTQTQLNDGKQVYPHQYRGTPAEIVEGYLSHLPLRALFSMPIPLSFDERRFQHQWVVAPTGSGKTQLLKAQIAADLDKVERGQASIVVLDSQGTKPGTLIGDLIRLKLFAPGQPLAGRLVFLDPDPAYPLALNLFDFGLAEIGGVSERERRTYLTSVIDLAEFIINGLVGAEQTPMMTGISRYLIQALMVIPDATVETFRDLMSKGGIDKYRPHLEELDDYTRDFFDTRFNAPQYEATKAGIFWRLDTMMSDPTFREMFLNPRNKLDLGKELNAGKVIVVNTDRELLKADGTEAFGRFILARLLLATQQRASEANPLPTYVYLDECHDYIADEERIADFVDKARKQKVGLIFAHQRLSNIRSGNVADALANTAIQFAGGNKTDAGTLAGFLHTDPEFIENQPALSFVAYIKGQTQRGVQVTVPFGVMEDMEKMSREEEAAMRAEMRERYSSPKRERRRLAPPPSQPVRTKWDE